MCAVCGCSGDGHDHDHDHDHDHEGHSHPHAHEGHSHPHAHERPGPAEMVVLERRLLDKNDRVAENNRAWLAGREILGVGRATDVSGERERNEEQPAGSKRAHAAYLPTAQEEMGARCSALERPAGRAMPLAARPLVRIILEPSHSPESFLSTTTRSKPGNARATRPTMIRHARPKTALAGGGT